MNAFSAVAQTSNPSGQFIRSKTSATGATGQYRPTSADFVSSFFAVLRRWESETKFVSDPDRITSHPSYQALVDNAPTVLKLVKDELSRNPSKLVWVLEDALHERPYTADDVGDFVKMSNRWIDFLDARD